MSARAVRKMVRGWLADPAMAVEFVETINEENLPTNSMWMTVEFLGGYREVLSICDGDIAENGEFELVFFAPPGTGDDALLTAAEADIKTLMAQRDATNKLTLLNREPWDEYTNGDADGDYALSTIVEYVYYE